MSESHFAFIMLITVIIIITTIAVESDIERVEKKWNKKIVANFYANRFLPFQSFRLPLVQFDRIEARLLDGSQHCVDL